MDGPWRIHEIHTYSELCWVPILNNYKTNPPSSPVILFEAKKMTALKADDKSAADVATGDVLTEFRGYNLAELGLPRSARPRAGFPYAGKHGYTLKAPNGAVTRSKPIKPHIKPHDWILMDSFIDITSSKTPIICRCDLNLCLSYEISEANPIKLFLLYGPGQFSFFPACSSQRPAKAIEVLLKTRAFVVKRLASSVPTDGKAASSSDSVGYAPNQQQRLGQITWGKFGGASNAWSIAVMRAGFPGATE